MTSKLHQPSDAQWEAIRCTDQHILINAGAGTGKTFTVVMKALYLMGVEVRGTVIDSPLRLRDIAAITYTNKAAAELKDSLRSSLRAVGRRRDAYQVDSARVGTIHGFCSDILREFALRRGAAPDLALLGDAESAVLRDEVVRDTLLAALEQDSVEGLPGLLSVSAVKEVEQWISELLDRGDTLDLLNPEAGDLGQQERVLVHLAQSAHVLLMERLKQAGQMDYDRMIVWTRDLIRDDATVRKALQRRIKVLIVDECQDVDPVQREIAYLLANPTHRRTDTTRLVFVGDPKQSIYRFRKADVTVWRGIERDFTTHGAGRVVALTESRRSIPPVLAFVDHAIGTLLDTPLDDTRGLQDFEVPYAPLTSLRADGARNHGVEFITVPAANTGKPHNAEDVRRSEAQAIAERAGELHESGLEWRDMAVLLCGWGAVETYTGALRDAGIPAYTLRAEGYYGCREVLDVIVALDAIRDPESDRALFGFLRSPFVGLRDESLLHIARQTTLPSWRQLDAVRLPAPGEQILLTQGRELLARCVSLRDRVSIAELIEQLLDDTGYLVHLELLGDTAEGVARQRLANVQKLVRIAGASLHTTLSDFLRFIERERELHVKEGEARLYGERDDVVTVTSVHSAKGLEWRCVFWSDLVRGKRSDTGKLLVSGDRITLGEPDKEPDEQSAAWQAVRATIEAEQDAETKRLWYVAATRARDLLILSGIPLGTGGRMSQDAPAFSLKKLFPALDAGHTSVQYSGACGTIYTATVRQAHVVARDNAELPAANTVTATEAIVNGVIEIDLTDIAQPLEQVNVSWGRGRHSASELMSFQRCERRHWMMRVAGIPEPALASQAGKHRIDGDEVNISAVQHGLIVHDVLEHFTDRATVSDMVDAAILRCSDDKMRVDPAQWAAQREQIVAEIEDALSRPEYRSLRDAGGSRREIPFTFIDGSDCFEGQLDLVASDDDGYHIVDIKTGTTPHDTAAMIAEKTIRYDLQRTLYTKAVEAITGCDVRTFVFYFTGSSIQHQDTLHGPWRDEAEARLTSEVTRINEGGRSLAVDAVACGFCGYRAAQLCPGTTTSGPGHHRNM